MGLTLRHTTGFRREPSETQPPLQAFCFRIHEVGIGSCILLHFNKCPVWFPGRDLWAPLGNRTCLWEHFTCYGLNLATVLCGDPSPPFTNEEPAARIDSIWSLLGVSQMRRAGPGLLCRLALPSGWESGGTRWERNIPDWGNCPPGKKTGLFKNNSCREAWHEAFCLGSKCC